MRYDPVYINATKINETTTNYIISGLHPSLNYTFSGYIMDLFNNTKDQDYVTFCKLIVIHSDSLSLYNIAIYHVQGLTLQYYSDNGSVVVECRFAERSTADGCHVIFKESSKRIVTSISMIKSSIEESTVYQYISLPVSGNYTVTAHDIVDGTIITNPSVKPQELEYILILPSPTQTVVTTSKLYVVLFCIIISL